MNKNNGKNGKLTGFAITALRAYIKALELNKGQFRSKGEYRYELPKPGNPDPKATARIFVVATNETVEGYEKPLDEWIKPGKQIRLAFIGLRQAKIALDEQAGKPVNVRYSLNAITGEASLTTRGEPLPDKPTTIAEWAKIGRDVEQPLFDALKKAQESLRAAVDYGSEDGQRDARKEIEELRAKMIACGVIRDPRQGPDQG